MNKQDQNVSRRIFLKRSTAAGAGSLLPFPREPQTQKALPDWKCSEEIEDFHEPLDLSPARWIWYPSRRTLANTFLLFRRELKVEKKVKQAKGWLLAESRYVLYLNGKRLQFGPAPSDPRWPEADPVDLTSHLRAGENVIGVQVLYYGFGDGTWPIGKPGYLFYLEIEWEDGSNSQVVSDRQWQVHLPRSWQPGHYKRWYLRALQEEFDARKYPSGWREKTFEPDQNWLQAMEIRGRADKPALCHSYGDYLGNSQGRVEECEIRARTIPFPTEQKVYAKALVESVSLKWHRSPQEYFECETPDAFSLVERMAVSDNSNEWNVDLKGRESVALTFELEEQIVGFPFLTITAPAGTIIELMVQEGHEVGGPVLMNNHFHAWTRFTCREGINHFECSDFESLRWIQLLIRNAETEVKLKEIGVRRRKYPWQQEPVVNCSDRELQQLLDAAVNTLHNAAQETLVDGMGRERQQYSGDIGHAIHALFLAFGNASIAARFVHTYSQGMTKDGFFLDCWPAYDRLHRLAQRQLDLTPWGPLLDHGVGFNFDCYYYYLYSGDLSALKEVYPRLRKFLGYLKSIQMESGLLPVVDIGVPTVWIDHNAYPIRRHRQCVFNLYAIGMLRKAFAPLADAFADDEGEKAALALADELLAATIRFFWSPGRKLFVDNLPWLAEEGKERFADRTLATAYLYDLFPNGATSQAIDMLVRCPPEMGLSYPANAGWRLWALAKAGEISSVLSDFRDRWAKMDSIRLNNTLQEGWEVKPDSNGQWSHCPVAPLYVTYMNLAGIRPLEPGFKKVEIRPQLGDLESLDLVIPTPVGDIRFSANGPVGKRKISIELPSSLPAELVLDESEEVSLPLLNREAAKGLKRYECRGLDRLEIELLHS